MWSRLCMSLFFFVCQKGDGDGSLRSVQARIRVCKPKGSVLYFRHFNPVMRDPEIWSVCWNPNHFRSNADTDFVRQKTTFPTWLGWKQNTVGEMERKRFYRGFDQSRDYEAAPGIENIRTIHQVTGLTVSVSHAKTCVTTQPQGLFITSHKCVPCIGLDKSPHFLVLVVWIPDIRRQWVSSVILLARWLHF